MIGLSLRTDPGEGEPMACRPGCGACCIAPSITSPLPRMPAGKPAGVRCAHLTLEQACDLFGHPDRPAVCGGLKPSLEMCGKSVEQALHWLAKLEQLTAPEPLILREP